MTTVLINELEAIPDISQCILKTSSSRIISDLHLELFSINAKWGKVNDCFNCSVIKLVTWVSGIKIVRLILGFENFAIN